MTTGRMTDKSTECDGIPGRHRYIILLFQGRHKGGSEESARISGDIYADLRRKGVTIGTSDIMIAGIAIENDLTLVTNNERHYELIQGLAIENWKR